MIIREVGCSESPLPSGRQALIPPLIGGYLLSWQNMRLKGDALRKTNRQNISAFHLLSAKKLNDTSPSPINLHQSLTHAFNHLRIYAFTHSLLNSSTIITTNLHQSPLPPFTS